MGSTTTIWKSGNDRSCQWSQCITRKIWLTHSVSSYQSDELKRQHIFDSDEIKNNVYVIKETMFIPKNQGLKRTCLWGCWYILQHREFASNAAKQIASTALGGGKSVVKEAGKKAVDVGKTAALDAVRKLIEKGVTHVCTPKFQAILKKHVNVPTSGDAITKKAHNILNKYLDVGAQNINTLIDGSGTNAISIQDLVKNLDGSGLIFFKYDIYIQKWTSARSTSDHIIQLLSKPIMSR